MLLPVLTRSHVNVGSIKEPDVVVLIFQKVCFHLQYLVIVNLGHIVGYFKALFQAVSFVLLILKQLLVICHRLEGGIINV